MFFQCEECDKLHGDVDACRKCDHLFAQRLEVTAAGCVEDVVEDDAREGLRKALMIFGRFVLQEQRR